MDPKMSYLGPAIFDDVPLRKMTKDVCFFVNAKDTWIFMKITQNPRVLGVNEKTWIFDENIPKLFKCGHFEQFWVQF